MSRADLWLMRNYWDFDFPRPVLPNFIFLGGVHCQPAKPLPKVWAVFNTMPFFFYETSNVHYTDSSTSINSINVVFTLFFSLQDMEEFVQSSKDDGIVVFSLGSMINNMTREKGNMMAKALAQIPQKVDQSSTIARKRLPLVHLLN